MIKIKICGITNKKDALFAADYGVDALGFIFAESQRKISPFSAKRIIKTLPPFITRVGVFVNENENKVNEIADFCGLDAVQLHGNESPKYCKKIRTKVIKAFRVKKREDLSDILKYDVCAILLDTYSRDKFGGTGKTFDWDIALYVKKFGIPLILSGGLNLSNIAHAIEQVQPYAVDISSGIEVDPGKKDIKKMKRVFEIVKSKKESQNYPLMNG